MRDVTGLHGQYLFVGDEVQMPGNYALDLVRNKCAVFLFEGSTKAEIDFIERARKMGYKVEAPKVNAADRPEFQFLKKKKGWIAETFDPGLKKS